MRVFSEALNNASQGVQVIAVKETNAESASSKAQSDTVPFPLFSDMQKKVRTAYRLNAEAETVMFVLDANLRVLDRLFLRDAVASAQQVRSILNASLPSVEPLKIAMHAPVLLVPNVLEPQICADLIAVWHDQGSVETGVEQTQDGRRQDTLTPDRKRRRDHIVMDQALLKLLTSTIGRRIMPEVRKAFAFKATRFEGFKIVCYDAAAGGFFHAHRDNLSPSTAHRRFALTLNLNEDYEGGHLKFPEYGPHLYRPEQGNALLFSCSHLHEVTKVNKGRRFALLSFLFGEGDVRAR